MTTRRLVLTAYDVVEASRLRAALKVVTAYSHGGQKSCHETWTAPAERRDLAAGLDGRLKPDEDKWAQFGLGAEPRCRILGRARMPEDPPMFLFGWNDR